MISLDLVWFAYSAYATACWTIDQYRKICRIFKCIDFKISYDEGDSRNVINTENRNISKKGLRVRIGLMIWGKDRMEYPIYGYTSHAYMCEIKPGDLFHGQISLNERDLRELNMFTEAAYYRLFWHNDEDKKLHCYGPKAKTLKDLERKINHE